MIAYEAGGSGPSLVLVHGALSDRRHAFGAVRPLLERRFTVYALDRRGHGDSDDAPSYACPAAPRRGEVPSEGWKHFQESRETIERELAAAPDDIRSTVRWLPLGIAVELAAHADIA